MITVACLVRSAMTALAVCPFRTRSGNGENAVKTTAVLEALVNVAPEKPAKATALATPGVAFAISETRRVTASVRDSEAPSGN